MNEKLLRRRLKKGWSQAEAAEAIGVATRTYQRWEYGISLPNFESRRMLRKAFEAEDRELGIERDGFFGTSTEEPGFLLPPAQVIHYVQGKQSSDQGLPESAVPSPRLPDSKDDELALGLGLAGLQRLAFPTNDLLPPEEASRDWGIWLSERLASILVFVVQWKQRRVHYVDFQKMLDRELRMFEEIKAMSNPGESVLSRRNALLVIAAFPTGLLAPFQWRQQAAFIEEELLPACAASITSCWHLLNDGELASVEQVLSRYLPALVQWARQPSASQKTAAYLASQGYLLLGLIAHHRLQAQQRVRYTEEAVVYAREADDPVLLVQALMQQGDALYYVGAYDAMLHRYQEARYLLEKSAPTFPQVQRGRVPLSLAHAYAQQGQAREALNAISEARIAFSQETEALPPFLAADEGLFTLILVEGWTHLDLGMRDPKRAHYESATKAFAQVEDLPKTVFVPQRFRIEIRNRQAQAAVGLGDLEAFHHSTLQSVEGLKHFASEKRRQELIINFRAARQRWPHEPRLLELADVLL
jgi:transcriptional regulator with XRE-family HTH domain/tetratricopeptide (TPR) repeat protein